MKKNNNWHDSQNDDVSRVVDVLKQIQNSESPTRRIRAYLDEFISEKHFMNVFSEFKKDEKFKVVDVGCGTGTLLSRLERCFPNAELYGYDSNDSSLEEARNSSLNVVYANATFSEIPKSKYDVVVCSEVFEHVEDTDALLNKLFDLCEIGGIISFSTPSGWMFRKPSIRNLYLFLKKNDFYNKVCLRPEENWLEALPYHPATQPQKVINRFREKGGAVISRQSSIWEHGENAFPYKRYSKKELNENKVLPAIKYYSWMLFMESLMELFPPFRIYESRFILSVRNRKCPTKNM